MVISEIINKCADLFYINRDMITSKSKMRTAVRARQALAMALSIRGHSTSAIGRWLDRDHTTIMYNLEMAKEMMARDSMFGQKVFTLAQMVHQPDNPHPQRHKQTRQYEKSSSRSTCRRLVRSSPIDRDFSLPDRRITRRTRRNARPFQIARNGWSNTFPILYCSSGAERASPANHSGSGPKLLYMKQQGLTTPSAAM